MPLLQVHLLGDFRLIYDQELVTAVTSARLQALITYLLLHRNAPQPRHYLAFLFWPDSPEPQARSSLRNLLHQLRHTLPNGDRFVRIDTQTIQWTSDEPFTLDVADFQDAIKQAETARDKLQMETHLVKAISYYQGDLLPSCYDEWIAPEREQLRIQYGESLTRLIQHLEERREYHTAIQYVQKLLQHDPLHETTYRQLMRLYALDADRASALRTYHTCATVLQRELGVEPDRETRALYEQLLATTALRVPVLDTQDTAQVMIGRTHEWAQLQDLWSKVTRGRPEFVLITGEAGIGKTRLATALTEWAGRQGFATAIARCYAAEGELAYAPIVSWLRSDQAQQALERVEDVWLMELVRLLPEIAIQRPDLPEPKLLSESWQRQRIFEALVQAILAIKPPLMLVLDDLQWCDQDTLEWLHYLLRAVPRAPLLLIATLRAEAPISPTLTLTLTSLRSTLSFTEIKLGPLALAEVASLAERTAGYPLTASQVDYLYEETEGNPLFVEEVVRAKLSRPADQLSNGQELPHPTPSGLPSRIQLLIQARLAQLSATTREVAGVAAVIGREFTFEVLVAATNSDEETLVQVLDELWEHHLIREHETGGYDFSHDKIREVVYASLSSARRRFLHRRVGAALTAVHTDDVIAVSGQAAAHFEKGDSLDQALRYYIQAASQAASLHAYYTAQELYGHAISLAQKLNLSGQKLIEIYLARGRMLEHAGHYAEAVEVYQALEYLGRVRRDYQVEAAAVVQLIKCYLEPDSVHDPAQAAPLLRRGLYLARELHDPDLESQLLWSQMVYGSHYEADEEAQAAGEASVALARQHGLHERLAYVLNDLAINLRLSGQPERGQACADEAKVLFREMGNLPMLADSLSQQAWSDYHALRLDRALANATDCIRFSQEIHNGWNLSLATLVRAGILLAQGAWGEALVDLEASQQYGQESGFVIALTLTPAVLGGSLREIGDLDTAWTLHHQAHATSSRQAPFLLHVIEAQLALNAFAKGQVAEGQRWLSAMHTHQPRGAIARAWLTLSGPVAATVAGAEYTGAWTTALNVVEKSLAEAQQRRLPIYLPELMVHRGRCLAMLCRDTEAALNLQDAIATAETRGLHPILWKAHAALMDLYKGQGRTGEAKRHGKAATEAIQEIANSLAEPAYRASFLARPTVQRCLAASI